MFVREIITSAKINTITGDTTVLEAVVKMTKLNIGALIIGTPKKIEGIFSERDILKKVVGIDLPLESTKVKDVMTRNVTVIEDSKESHIALNIMKTKKFRHIPVVNQKGVCVSMLGLRSLMTSISENIENENIIMASRINDKEVFNILVKDIMHKSVHLVENDITVLQAVKIMKKLNIGSILIGKPNKLEGIFSERDLIKKVVSSGLSGKKTMLKDVMTKNLHTVEETENEKEVLIKMRKNNIRHLPVVNKDGVCVGMLGIRNLMDSMLERIENDNKIIVDYLLSVSRVALVIMRLGGEKFLEDGEQLIINHKLNKSKFEDLSDTSKETLNKILKSFEDEGLITVSKNKIVILDKTKFMRKII